MYTLYFDDTIRELDEHKRQMDEIKEVIELSKETEEIPLGKKQKIDISEMYTNHFNDIQREAFLLGRIYALLDFGNAISESANDAIKSSESALEDVRTRMNKKATVKKTKTTKKKETKNE